jgi:hypothetical protein
MPVYVMDALPHQEREMNDMLQEARLFWLGMARGWDR